jgi:hypothetical protein
VGRRGEKEEEKRKILEYPGAFKIFLKTGILLDTYDI